ncbi:MAG: Tic20 family protein [Cyanobacteria bacterium P01_A01_bin.135]
MTWRGQTSTWDRVFACLVYVLPLMEAYAQYGQVFLSQFPQLNILFIPLWPFLFVYGLLLSIFPFGLGGLVIFIALIALVVRNEKIRHFVRFNTMQAILIGIALSIFGLLWSLLFTVTPGFGSSGGIGGGILGDTVANVLFLGTVALSVYAIVQSARGRYAEIPTLSDAVYMQVR